MPSPTPPPPAARYFASFLFEQRKRNRDNMRKFTKRVSDRRLATIVS